MRQLSGRALDIVSGKSELPSHIVQKYRERLSAVFVLPDATNVDTRAPIVKPSQPSISSIGTQLREVIETEIGRQLTCGDCLGYLRKLNTTDTHDHDSIVQYLSAQFPWPAEWRERNTRRREAISALIEGVVPRKQGPS